MDNNQNTLVTDSIFADHATREKAGEYIPLLVIERESRSYRDNKSHAHLGKFRLTLQEIANDLQGNAISAAKSGIMDLLHSPMLGTASNDPELGKLYADLFQHARIQTYVSGNGAKQETAKKLNWEGTQKVLSETGTLGKIIGMVANDVPDVYDVVSRLFDWSNGLKNEDGEPCPPDYNPFAEGKGTRKSTTFATMLGNGLTIGQYLSKAIAGNANKLDWRFYAEHARKDSSLTELEKDRISRLLTGEKADANAKK
jgi:hypothetical protein